MAKVQVSKADLKQLYDENFFYEYGDNPANKKYIEIMQANLKDGNMPEFRSYLFNNRLRWFMARDCEDIFQRDLKFYTFPRAFAGLTVATLAYTGLLNWTFKNFPLGHNGVTRLGQTQFCKTFGITASRIAVTFPFIGFYFWYKLANFTTRKFWNHVVLGDRAWAFELERNTPVAGDYYFADSPLASEENFPDLARGEMARPPASKPDWLK